jgi:nitrogen regulatory protein P-II 1
LVEAAAMIMVEAIIKPHKLEDVKSALSQVGVRGVTVSEVRGFGRQKGHSQQYRGAEYAVDLIPKLKLELVIPDLLLADATKAILRSARTGEIGDGKIFVYSIDSATRIRTGEQGERAI